jgi:hypothetical protein
MARRIEMRTVSAGKATNNFRLLFIHRRGLKDKRRLSVNNPEMLFNKPRNLAKNPHLFANNRRELNNN